MKSYFLILSLIISCVFIATISDSSKSKNDLIIAGKEHCDTIGKKSFENIVVNSVKNKCLSIDTECNTDYKKVKDIHSEILKVCTKD